MKKILSHSLVLGCLLSISTFASTSSGHDDVVFAACPQTTVYSFRAGWQVCDLEANLNVHSILETLIMHVSGTLPYHPKNQNGFTLEEAKMNLEGPLRRLLTESGVSEEQHNDYVEKIFTEEYFAPQTSRVLDISASMGEEELFRHLSNDPYLDSTLFNTIQSLKRDGDFDEVEVYKGRIDARLFMLPARLVSKWYFTQTPTWHKMSLQDYEARVAADPETLYPGLFAKHFSFPEREEDKKDYYLAHTVGFLSQELIGNIYKGARTLAAQVKPGERIVIFGNTPYFLGRALEALFDKGACPVKPMYLPFSGAPNTLTERNLIGATNDIVTRDRFAHFCGFLDKKGLLGDDMLTGTTHIVDVIGAGTGPAYTMGTVLEHFKGKGVPQFHIFSISQFREDEPRNVAITDVFAKDGMTTTLYFPHKDDPFFSVPATVVYVKGHGAMDFMPDHCPALRSVPKYNPIFWNSAYDGMLEAPLGGSAQLLLDHFDVNLAHIMSQEEAAL